MRIGFGRRDITPRVGVELCGFGPFLNRHSIGVRDRLWARAVAFEAGRERVVLVSCDLVGVKPPTTNRVRALVQEATGIGPQAVMVHCTHTHSGPNTDRVYGWGDPDLPYLETLPQRIAAACVDAVGNLTEATLSHAEVPCTGIALNRERDRDAPPLEEVLQENWQPTHPEWTDTTCHVFRADAGDRLLGFLSNYGCHPVTCCQQTRYIHGDFVGVATNLLEREHEGAVGLFLQGAQGDINSCVVHKPEQESLLALDVIAGRYARAVRRGLVEAKPLQVDEVRAVTHRVTFSRRDLDLAGLRKWLAEKEAILHAPGASDTNGEVRMAAVYVTTLRELIARAEAGLPLNAPTELQGFRLGSVALLGAPFEIFREIKQEILGKARLPITVVLGLTNDALGYAPDRETAARGGYAAEQVPIMKGDLPFTDIHGELVRELLALDAALAG